MIAKRTALGLVLIATGQWLIVDHLLPWSYFTFPLVWYGFIITVDAAVEILGRQSLWTVFMCRGSGNAGGARSRLTIAAMIPLSAAFWWLFELFNVAVHNWRYSGDGAFTGAAYVAFASLCFSTVIPAVWETTLLIEAFVGKFWPGAECREHGSVLAALLGDIGGAARSATGRPRVGLALNQPPESRQTADAPDGGRLQLSLHQVSLESVLRFAFACGVACLVLPILFPHYAFALIWGSLFFLLDPLNATAGQPSLIVAALNRQTRTIILFATAALVCGFCWEFWNYWSVMKWTYDVPFVSQLHLFEMPVPGYLGYLPFGLEVFAATIFGLRTLPVACARVAAVLSVPRARESRAVRR